MLLLPFIIIIIITITTVATTISVKRTRACPRYLAPGSKKLFWSTFL